MRRNKQTNPKLNEVIADIDAAKSKITTPGSKEHHLNVIKINNLKCILSELRALLAMKFDASYDSKCERIDVIVNGKRFGYLPQHGKWRYSGSQTPRKCDNLDDFLAKAERYFLPKTKRS